MDQRELEGKEGPAGCSTKTVRVSPLAREYSHMSDQDLNGSSATTVAARVRAIQVRAVGSGIA